MFEPFAAEIKEQLSSVVELLRDSKPHSKTNVSSSGPSPNKQDCTVATLPANTSPHLSADRKVSQVPEAVIELMTEPVTLMNQDDTQAADTNVACPRPPGFLPPQHLARFCREGD